MGKVDILQQYIPRHEKIVCTILVKNWFLPVMHIANHMNNVPQNSSSYVSFYNKIK